MPDIWNRLGKARLQQLIGAPVLDRLERLLPALDPDREPDEIYGTDGLATIFDRSKGKFEGGTQASELANS